MKYVADFMEYADFSADYVNYTAYYSPAFNGKIQTEDTDYEAPQMEFFMDTRLDALCSPERFS